MDLGGAAEAVGVLDGMDEVVGVAGPDLRAFDEPGDGGRRFGLTRVGTETVEVGSEGSGGSHEGFDRHRTGDVGGDGEVLGPVEGERPLGQHTFGAVEETQTLLGEEPEGFEAVGGEGLGGRAHPTVVAKQSLSDEGKGEVGEGGQVTGGADGTLGWDDGKQIPAEELDESLHHRRPDPRMALGEGAGPEQQHRPDDLVGKGVADAGGVASQQPNLELFGFVTVDPSRCQGAETRGDPVDGGPVGDRPVDDLPGRRHPFGHSGVEAHRRPPVGNRNHVVDAQRPSVDHHLHGRRG